LNSSSIQPRSSRIGRNATPSPAKLLARLFLRRWRTRSPDKLPDHLLRDAGLERVGGMVMHRVR
jgi:hypothetical protein